MIPKKLFYPICSPHLRLGQRKCCEPTPASSSHGRRRWQRAWLGLWQRGVRRGPGWHQHRVRDTGWCSWNCSNGSSHNNWDQPGCIALNPGYPRKEGGGKRQDMWTQYTWTSFWRWPWCRALQEPPKPEASTGILISSIWDKPVAQWSCIWSTKTKTKTALSLTSLPLIQLATSTLFLSQSQKTFASRHLVSSTIRQSKSFQVW